MFRTRCACLCLACFFAQAAFTIESGDSPNKLLAQEGGGKKPAGKRRPPAHQQQGKKPVHRDVTQLSLEVKALRALRGLEATPDQLAEISRIAKNTAAKPGKREPAKAAPDYVETLKELRESLVANDAEKVDTLREKLDDLEEKQTPDIDDQVEITDSAELEAARLLNRFTPQQIAAYADNLGDDFPDPVKLIANGLDDSRQSKEEEWKATRDELAEKVSWIVCGRSGEKALKFEQEVSNFLDRIHADGSKPDAGGIRKLVGSPGPIVLLKNVVEHDLAELLSNPQLGAATKACLRGHAPQVAAGEEPELAAPPARKARHETQGSPPAGRPRIPEHQAAVADLDEVLKSPEKYDDQDLKFQNVTVTGTARARAANMLWLEVKTGSGETVRAAVRDQKLTFVIAKAAVPESIAQMSPGASITATLVCHVKAGPQPSHWFARVRRIELGQK